MNLINRLRCHEEDNGYSDENEKRRSGFKEKMSTKLIIAGTTIGVVVSSALIAKHFVNVDRYNHSVQIIGDADDPTSVFLAGKVPADRKQAEYTSISMEEANRIIDLIPWLDRNSFPEMGSSSIFYEE